MELPGSAVFPRRYPFSALEIKLKLKQTKRRQPLKAPSFCLERSFSSSLIVVEGKTLFERIPVVDKKVLGTYNITCSGDLRLDSLVSMKICTI